MGNPKVQESAECRIMRAAFRAAGMLADDPPVARIQFALTEHEASMLLGILHRASRAKPHLSEEAISFAARLGDAVFHKLIAKE